MKYTVLTPLKHNGKRLEEGATVNLEECAATDRLVDLGAVEPAGRNRGPQVPPKTPPAAAQTDPALDSVPPQDPGTDPSLVPPTGTE